MSITAILPDDVYDDLVSKILAEPELINLMECPSTGKFERATVADRLGGDWDIWPERCRALLEICDIPERPDFLLKMCPALAN